MESDHLHSQRVLSYLLLDTVMMLNIPVNISVTLVVVAMTTEDKKLRFNLLRYFKTVALSELHQENDLMT
jgi:hypothetical protein